MAGNDVGKQADEPGVGRGRMGGPLAAGPGGVCVCPKCDHEEEHDTGDPRTDSICPKCGATLERKVSEGEKAVDVETWSAEDRQGLADAATAIAKSARAAGLDELAAKAETLAKQAVAPVAGEVGAAVEGGDNEREGECPEALRSLDSACPFRADLKGQIASAEGGAGTAPGPGGAAPTV